MSDYFYSMSEGETTPMRVHHGPAYLHVHPDGTSELIAGEPPEEVVE